MGNRPLVIAVAAIAVVLLVWLVVRAARRREDFLNSGAPELVRGAERWARLRGYRITYRSAGRSATWGTF
ncbi:hypothetical protein [Kribbella sp. NPDC051770]|uniref:hypothetical protein n=1 Tax=Kribbella sp. NPDC051770 TaxID=3155413 RepID=UPI00342DC5B1